MDIKLVFNSEENYNSNMCIKLDDKNILNFDKIVILRVNNIIEIDTYTDNVFLIDKLELIISDLKNRNINNIKCYPDFNNLNIFFDINLTKLNIYENKTLFNLTKLFKFYCIGNIDLFYEKNFYKDFNDSYNIIANDSYLSNEEKEYIQLVLNKQHTDHWFNDQNILVENEYKRIENIKNKKNIVSTNKVFDPSILKIINGPSDPMYSLNKIIGLNNIKHEIERLKYTLEYKNKRQKKGVDDKNSSMHMCFYGNPGTGKTTIARIMTGLLYEMGFIKENKCIEINGLELKGAHIGQTATITKGILDYSKGGVLFIDEAYTLYDINDDNFGKEAVNTFIKEMEDSRDELVIIFAGYKAPMDKLLNSNAGLRSRIKKYFTFDDYNTLELLQIFINLLRDKHLYITKDALEKVTFLIKDAKKHQNFGNGRYIFNLINHIEENHILNVDNISDYTRIDSITIEDVDGLNYL